MQNSKESKLPCSYRKQMSLSVRLGQRERWTANMYKETLGDDGSILCIDYGGEFSGDASVKTCQFYKFTK